MLDRGTRPFLIDRVATTADMAGAVSVPAGFTAARLTVPEPKDGMLYLALRDAPGVVFTMAEKR